MAIKIDPSGFPPFPRLARPRALALALALAALGAGPVLASGTGASPSNAPQSRAEPRPESRPLLAGLALAGAGAAALLVAAAAARRWRIRSAAQRRARTREQLDPLERKLRAAEASVRRLNEEAARARRADRAKSDYLASMSHEIRTPLNSIIGLINLVMREELTDEQRGKLRHALVASEHLLAVINNVLDLSRIEAGRMVLESVEFDFDELFRRLTSIVGPGARAKGLEFVLDTTGAPRAARGDPTRLLQAVLNLVGNAIKFTDQGYVIVHCRQVRAEAGEIELRIEVEDSGIGVPPDRIEALFDDYEQQPASAGRAGGSGLGLAITRRLAALMGGAVGATSTPGNGSVFWMSVRLGRVEHPVERATEPATHGCRTLILEDRPELAQAKLQMVRTLLPDATSFTSLPELLERLSQADREGRPFTLAIMAHHPPKLDGICTLSAIRDLGLKTAPLTVLVAREPDFELLDSARALGCAHVLLEPVSAPLLRRWISTNADPDHPSRAGERVEEAIARQYAGRRVLLVDDDPIARMITQAMLRQAGLEVTAATNGRQACEIVSRSRHDLILLDMEMPVMNGVEAARAIRGLEHGREVPIIAMTANAFTEDRTLCLDAGMDEFLAKPVDAREFFSTIRRCLAGRPTPAL